MKKRIRPLVVLAGILAIAGCATSYPVRINSYLDVGYSQKLPLSGVAFYVRQDPAAKNQILESQLKSKIERLLIKNGYTIVAPDKAAYAVSFSYSLSRGRMVMEQRPEYRSGDVVPIYTRTSSGETQTSYVTFPGYTAYVPYWYRVYTASLTLKVTDVSMERSDKREHQVWIGEAHTSSTEADLQGLLDYLLAGVFKYFGQDTGKAVVTDIGKDDPVIKSIGQ